MLFIDSLLAALSPFTLAMNFVGVMLGMIVGALPGLGSVVAITICLPFTFGMTSVSAIALLLGVYCGSICGGSIAAVLINTPGTPQSAATAFDGYPMARAGKPGKAIGWALAASIFGGVFSCVILTFAAPQIAVFALQFGPLETCALILMGLTCISSVSANNQFKGLAMGVLGLLLACVGMSPFSAESRFTFDIFALNSGIDLVAVIVGVFALSEVLDRVERMRREARVENGTSCRVQLPSLGEWRGRMSGLVKSSLIGTFVGILPGTGDFAAVEKKSGAFETLGDCTIVGFVSCGGCPGSKAIARAQALMDRGAQAIALATCITKGNPSGFPCPNRDSILQALRKKCKEVPVLEYTH